MAELGTHHHGLMYRNMYLQHVTRVAKKQQWASGNGDLDFGSSLPSTHSSNIHLDSTNMAGCVER